MGFDAPWHWVILALVVIALFGYKKLPDASRSLGRSLRIFKTEIKGMGDDDKAREEAKSLPAAQTTPVQAAPVAPPAPVAEPVAQPVVAQPMAQPVVAQPVVAPPVASSPNGAQAPQNAQAPGQV